VWADRALKWVGLKRIAKPQAQFWNGARQDRLVLDWIWNHLSADQEIRGDLVTLRGRARSLTRNDGWAKRYIRLMVKNVIGPRGVQLQARLVRANDLPNDEANDKIEAAWARWGQRGTPTADGKYSWHGVERQVMKGLATDGEVFLRILRGFPNAFGFALQFLDPDQLDVNYNCLAEPGKNAIRMGVEVDGWNRPVVYHFWRAHPSEPGGRIREPVPAADVLHLHDPDRVNQTRGVPWMSPVLLDVHMLNGYYEAELVASREAAAKGGFYVQKSEDGATISVSATQESLEEDVEPGKRSVLPYGIEWQGWDPQHPTSAFPEFSKALLHKVASGLDVSYASLTNDLADTSYSSSRVGLLDERDSYRDIQAWVIEGLHQRVYAAWAPFAVLNGQLDARIRTADYLLVEWVPRGWSWVDPRNDIDATSTAIENGLQSRTRALAEQGIEFEDVLRDLARERELAEELDVPLGESKAPPAAAVEQPEDLSPAQNRANPRSHRLLGVAP
jgi:lambda family phage portal protein